MISSEALEKLAKQYQSNLFPNIVREYLQHVFLQKLYQFETAEKMQFKGGTALRILYGSPRFSEDLDFSLFGVAPYQTKLFIENLLGKVLTEMERLGMKVEMGKKSDVTKGGYLGLVRVKMSEYPLVELEVNVSNRHKGRGKGEIDIVANDFVSTYSVVHLPQHELVEEKIFGALHERKKPRDFYDLYFMMRKGMLNPDQKKRLAKEKDEIIEEAEKINFRGELGTFLPTDQQIIIRDFRSALEAEMKRQIG